jgi:protein-S-isoprenylcysteine O-methyltransferase Ste14
VTWVQHLRAAGGAAADDPVLLFDGPFKWIRYPSLVCLFVYALGVSILFRSWIGLVMLLPLVGAIVNRVNNLDRMYAEQYKRIWPLRRHTSKRLIPYLY